MNPIAELKTIRDYIRYAMSRFNEAGLYYGHGTDNAWDEVIALILHTLHLPHHLDKSLLDANLLTSEREKILSLIDKRAIKRLPVPYLTNEAWFAGLSFYVDDRVLIPRSPIAELIENHFAPWIDENKVHSILDLCTGSGCIAIACAMAFPESTIDASDISKDALAVAKINVLRHDVEEQVHLYESDLFANLPQKKYDIIVSNPPYVSAEEMATLPPEYIHEPSIALAAGHEGLDFVLRILREAGAYLAPHGILVVEVGNSEVALANKYPNIPFTWLEFEHGGGGVFMLTAEQLQEAQKSLTTQSV
jgi:ribosomal protein L3 glutamine methyltransferase